MEHTGYIYIFTNPSFPEYVKIGYAKNVNQRLDELNPSTAVPFAFRVFATYEVDSNLSDKKIHSILDKLNPELRSTEEINGKKRIREFYAMTLKYIAGARNAGCGVVTMFCNFVACTSHHETRTCGDVECVFSVTSRTHDVNDFVRTEIRVDTCGQKTFAESENLFHRHATHLNTHQYGG